MNYAMLALECVHFQTRSESPDTEKGGGGAALWRRWG
jgi:hypothetical protein